jgi:hypothetical protein
MCLRFKHEKEAVMPSYKMVHKDMQKKTISSFTVPHFLLCHTFSIV